MDRLDDVGVAGRSMQSSAMKLRSPSLRIFVPRAGWSAIGASDQRSTEDVHVVEMDVGIDAVEIGPPVHPRYKAYST